MLFVCPSLTSFKRSPVCAVLFLYTSTMTSIQVLDSIFIDKTINEALQLHEYISYDYDVRIWKFEVPDLTLRMIISATGFGKPERCMKELQDVEIYQQYGSYPLINPRNETYPKNFYLDKSQLKQVATVKTDAKRNYIYMPAPLSGNWYFIAFLPPKKVDKKRETEGLGSSKCTYYLDLSFSKVVGSESNMELLSTNKPYILKAGPSTNSFYRFYVNSDVWKFDVKIKKCKNLDSSIDGCHLEALFRGGAIPVKASTGTVTLTCFEGPCIQTFAAPMTGVWHYITMNHLSNTTMVFILEITTSSCVLDDVLNQQGTKTLKEEGILVNNTNKNQIENLVEPMVLLRGHNAAGMVVNSKTRDDNSNTTTNICSLLPLSRQTVLGFNTGIQFVLLNLRRHIYLKNSVLSILPFKIEPSVEIGLTLHFSVRMNQPQKIQSKQNVIVVACIQKFAMPVDSKNIYCHGNSRLLLNSSSALSEVFVPYPQSGKWYLGFQARCSRRDPNNNSHVIYEACIENVRVDFLLSLDSCVRGGCSNFGYCKQYINKYGMFAYTRCSCKAGWRGYGCTDGTYAMPLGIQRLETCLPTLSNLFFIPSIVVTIYRGMYCETLVYAFTMFWSMFYHACKGDVITLFCLFPYDTMGFMDYICSLLSFWVTLIAMSKIPERSKYFFYILGTLGIVFEAKYATHGLATFMVPFVLGVVIMLGSWCVQCYRRKSCFPTKRRILIFIVPGTTLVTVAVGVFAFAETDANYPYTHSVWHMTISLSIAFLLPPKRTSNDESCSGISAKKLADTSNFTNYKNKKTKYGGNSDTEDHLVELNDIYQDHEDKNSLGMGLPYKAVNQQLYRRLPMDDSSS